MDPATYLQRRMSAAREAHIEHVRRMGPQREMRGGDGVKEFSIPAAAYWNAVKNHGVDPRDRDYWQDQARIYPEIKVPYAGKISVRVGDAHEHPTPNTQHPTSNDGKRIVGLSKRAMNILRQIGVKTTDDLRQWREQAVAAYGKVWGDSAALQKLPGCGKKTAREILACGDVVNRNISIASRMTRFGLVSFHKVYDSPAMRAVAAG